MKTFTFDWNCAIAVESGEPQAQFVTKLVELHRSEAIDVALTTVSASEALAGSKEFPGTAKQFRERVSALGWDDLTRLVGPAVVDLTYIDMSKWVGENFEAERAAIWQVVCPTIDRKLPSGLSDKRLWSPEFKKWRNAWCDVHTLWTHIDNNRDVFVTTNTSDFQRNFDKLSKLGLRNVLTPEQAIQELAI